MKIKTSKIESPNYGLTMIAVSVSNDNDESLCAKCLQILPFIQAYAYGVRSEDEKTIHHYATHKYCRLTQEEHEAYLNRIAQQPETTDGSEIFTYYEAIEEVTKRVAQGLKKVTIARYGHPEKGFMGWIVTNDPEPVVLVD